MLVARRFLTLVVALHGAAIAFAACESGDEGGDLLCDPGTNVFCRCPGGEAGTRPCLESGEEFGECVVAPQVPCGGRVECEPYTTIACLCPDGSDGLKECLREGTGYAECKLPSGDACPDPTGATSTSTTTTGAGGAGTGGGSGTGGSTGGCGHDVCSAGNPLSSSCGTCESAVCTADPYCCDTKWDSLCVALADQECDNICNPVVMCEHDLCSEGGPLTDGCDTCVTSVCAADEFCCDAELGLWDPACIDLVKDGGAHPDCSGLCCAHSECSAGAKLTETCSSCAMTVCGLDSWCCTNEWDALCVQKAEMEPSCNCL